jgi:ribonuclease J
MMVLEYGDAILVVDTGLMFPDDDMLGIDLILPDFSYVVENRDRVLGIIITHGHEDHVGALPYLLKEINVPVYGTRLTIGLINAKLGEHGLQGKTSLNEVSPGKELGLGPFRVEFLEVSHSIPAGVGLGIHTPVGTVVHSGDFKLDQTPIDGRPTAMQRFAELGLGGVLLLLSDSTNADIPGFTSPERSVGNKLDSIFALAQGRIIVASFASHIHRIQQVMDTAARHGRSLAIIGRSMVKNVNIAANLGYLSVPDGLIIRPNDIALLPPDRVAVLSTGSQGEPLSALARMAAHDHPSVEIMKGDTVIISARPVPVMRPASTALSTGCLRLVRGSSTKCRQACMCPDTPPPKNSKSCSTWSGRSTSCRYTASTVICTFTRTWPVPRVFPTITFSYWRTGTSLSWAPIVPE